MGVIIYTNFHFDRKPKYISIYNANPKGIYKLGYEAIVEKLHAKCWTRTVVDHG
jgi:hypothetical protein